MTKEQQLMRTLLRACASVRRQPHHTDGQSPTAKPRGFGHILDLLVEHSGISQQQLADSLRIRPQSISEAIGILESRRLIRKEASPTDRRVTLIHITEEGRAHATVLAEERRQHAQHFFSVLTEEEKDSLLQILTKLGHAQEDC